MEKKMFCYQCEQTAFGRGCTGEAGVCGKRADTAGCQDKLIGALIGLAMTHESCNNGCDKDTDYDRLVTEALFTTITNVSFNNDTIAGLTDRVHAAKTALAEKYGFPAAHDYFMEALWNTDENTRSLKSLILFGIKGMAAYAYHAAVLGYQDKAVNAFFYEALCTIGTEHTTDELLGTVLKTGEINLHCMELLDRANTESFGIPAPAEVSLTIEPGPFIVVTGHDLRDLKLLLEQTRDKGISIYTHGEMLPAHGYPKLREYPQLKGNFGTAWQNQQREFDNIPGAVLFTTNCLMPPKRSYTDRVFTTEVVSYPGITHIGEDKDFTPVIDKALELGGFSEPQRLTGINGGGSVMTGFAHGTVLSAASEIVDAVNSGLISHFFLIGGCDGARPGRNYYTELVKKTPPDSIILTLACGKYRFNDIDLGSIGPFPRIMDMGQCNDAYSAIRTAMALAKAFNCNVNELPLSIILSWYEQKAVCVLLTLLYLGIKSIFIGPTLPAFVSPDVLSILVEKFGITPTSTPDEDLKKILG